MERKVYLYQVADNQECLDTVGVPGRHRPDRFTPVITIELLATGSLGSKPGDPKSGVHNPEAFNADDYVALMPAVEFPGGFLEMESEYKLAQDRKHAASTWRSTLQKPWSAAGRLAQRRPAVRASGRSWTNLASHGPCPQALVGVVAVSS